MRLTIFRDGKKFMLKLEEQCYQLSQNRHQWRTQQEKRAVSKPKVQDHPKYKGKLIKNCLWFIEVNGVTLVYSS